jgi:hypothetical protein
MSQERYENRANGFSPNGQVSSSLYTEGNNIAYDSSVLNKIRSGLSNEFDFTDQPPLKLTQSQ